MKTYLTAEQFEEEISKLQKRCDRTALRISTYMLRKGEELRAQLSPDQWERVQRRFKAQMLAQQPKIIHPGNNRFN
jgi:hypothetical protein